MGRHKRHSSPPHTHTGRGDERTQAISQSSRSGAKPRSVESMVARLPAFTSRRTSGGSPRFGHLLIYPEIVRLHPAAARPQRGVEPRS